MKVLIEMSPEHYEDFLSKCDAGSVEYAILKNGVVAESQVDGQERRQIRILCDEEKAVMLFKIASRVCPEAAVAIAARTKFPDEP